MESELEQMLSDGLLDVPGDFTARVLHRVSAEPAPDWTPVAARIRMPLWKRLLQGLALAAGFVLGISQLVGFMFGLWTAAAVG